MHTRIGFSRAKGIPGVVSRVIMALTGAKASHAWLLYYSAELQMDVVLDAHETGFRAVGYKLFREKNYIVEVYQPKVNIDAAVPVAATWLGTPYDYKGLFGGIVVKLGQWLKRKWRNPARNVNVVYCSESVIRACAEVPYPGMEVLDPNDADPWELRNLLKSDGSELLVSC
jgi:hypothetical protein